MAFLGYWGDGPDWIEFQKWVTGIGVEPNHFRSRGGEGEFDNPWLMDSSKSALAGGYKVSLQVQPKIGEGSQRVGIPYNDIASGKYDDLITSKLSEFLVLPKRRRMPFEMHSEANVQHGEPGGHDAQPYSGTAAEYPAFAKKIDALARKAGVRSRLKTVLSMTGSPWNSNEWQTWYNGLDEVIDVFAVDGYSQPKSGQKKSPQDITAGVRKAARASGKKWAWFESGCQEDPKDPQYKASWFKAVKDLLESPEGDDCYAMFFNLSNDGPGGWPPNTSPQSYAAFKDCVGSLKAFGQPRGI